MLSYIRKYWKYTLLGAFIGTVIGVSFLFVQATVTLDLKTNSGVYGTVADSVDPAVRYGYVINRYDHTMPTWFVIEGKKDTVIFLHGTPKEEQPSQVAVFTLLYRGLETKAKLFIVSTRNQ